MENDNPRKKRKPAARLVIFLSFVYLFSVLGFLVILFGVSENWWLGVVFTYGPRAFALVPGILLLAISLPVDRRAVIPNLVGLVLVIFVAMEFQLPRPSSGPGTGSMRIASCNVNKFRPDIDSVIEEILALEPDLVVLQEAKFQLAKDLLNPRFEGWSIVQSGEYWIASRFPASLVESRRTDDFDREIAIAAKIEGLPRPFTLINIHTSTARHGIAKLSGRGPEGFRQFRTHQDRRKSEMEAAFEFASRFDEGPLLIAGDFNTPETSSLFEKFSARYRNAFAEKGLGYGFTAPCDRTGFLPRGWPWIRVDHLLVNDHFRVLRCRTGAGNGSDHRLICVDLVQESEP